MRAWDVVLDGRIIDTVFFNADMDVDEVQRALIDEGSYDPRLNVQEPDVRSYAPQPVMLNHGDVETLLKALANLPDTWRTANVRDKLMKVQFSNHV